MIPTVVVVLILASSALPLPLTTQQDVTTGTEEVPQIQTGISVPQHVQKTGVQHSFEVYTQSQTSSEQAEKSTVNSGAPEQYTKVNSSQQVIQAKKPAEIHLKVLVSLQNAAVPKVENVPANVEHAQSSYGESPVLLPIQSLSVVSANQAGQVVQPVVVPAEIIPADRMILMAIDSSTIQQRNFQQGGANTVPESQTYFQKVTESVTHIPVQTQETELNPVLAVEKQGQTCSVGQIQSNQNPLVTQQNVPFTYAAQSAVPVLQNYNQAPVEPNAQVYSVQQNTQPVVTENVKKQAVTGYVPAQTQFVAAAVQQQQEYHDQQSVEKQGSYQQRSSHTPVQNQVNVVKPTEFENIVKQGQYQQSSSVNTQYVDQNYEQQSQVQKTQQTVKNKVPYQSVSSYSPVQNQPLSQSVNNVQPSVAEKKTERLGQYQQVNSQVQTESAEQQQQQQQAQTQSFQEVAEKQVPYQQSIPVQNYPVELVNQQVYNVQPVPVQVQTATAKPVNQQQVFGTQPFTTGQVENQVQYQKGSHSQSVGYFPEEAPETEGLKETPSKLDKKQQFFNFQPQEIVQYADDHTYAFGDKIPKVQQNAPAYILTSVPQNQDYLVQPTVGST